MGISACSRPGCGFTSADSHEFNDHMRAHEASVRAAKEAAQEALRKVADENERELIDLENTRISAVQMQSAFNVIAPLVRAARLLMTDPKMKEFVIETARDFAREIFPPEKTEKELPSPLETDKA